MSTQNPNARLETFCDGVFAIALTLLIIDIKIPATAEINSTATLWLALKNILPSILAFVLSFAIILITWVNHHNAFKLAVKTSPAFIYANGVLLLSVVLIPFPTSLIGEYILTDYASPAVLLYNGVLILQSLGWVFICTTALNDKLLSGATAIKQTRQNKRYALYSVIGYSVFAAVSVWFPITIAIITVLLWILWLMIGIRIKNEDVEHKI
jgi:uncharacterized membrane protein